MAELQKILVQHKNKTLAIDYSRCIGCHLCELACSIKHEDIINPSLSRITILTQPESPVSIPTTCMQCEDAPCMRVCPVNAITYNPETGAYIINHDKCIGCYECVYACPFGAIIINRRAQVVKCDLCGGDPECVKVCPTNAIVYEKTPYKNTSYIKKLSRITDIYKP
ncbi:4Fe-4S dicluster domain-containing protein [Staphylothermus hellenicus]|uniref:4Fe-4S ferredoxin iron-sulfur binding domain protein n=1 Tax=Staphylothermus hellenicus (strain DSM 12710 / JCM 10830 / BK20S6-10-b1 / P8) TaxID=591019 RepID=D7D860_STAHD|nr:4Fe-4S dicluster domain-containing protein [Staphylothermus hellenicus]ADI31956.1 4Fe-4S ferredoxin iron-sulfur binding domain protein [Staphylothermus hellenicus DSM 12710]